MKTLVYTKTTGCPITNPLLGAATVMVVRGGAEGETAGRVGEGLARRAYREVTPIHLYFTLYYTEDAKYW